MELKFTDKTLSCKDCGQDFIFEAGEQRYYYSRRLQTPLRCPICREHRRATINPDNAELAPGKDQELPIAEPIGGTFSGPWPGGAG